MTHVFIINPKAGKKKTMQEMFSALNELKKMSNNVKVYRTERKGHAVDIADAAVRKYSNLRIYACGGDGTINEVLQSVVGKPDVEFGCIPTGSGNDFIKNFRKDKFLNLEKQVTANSVPIDVIKATGEFGSRYSLNVVSLSWDSRVAIEVEQFKNLPAVSGPVAYGMSVLKQLIKKESTNFSIKIDDEYIPTKEYMIGMCANGSYYGGGFMGAPFAKLNDGLFELVLVETITRRQVLRLFPKYQNGKHLTANLPEFEEIMTYKQGEKLRAESDKKIPVTIDGEGYYTEFIECEIIPNAIKLIVPDTDIENVII